jgi:hypothetical protein
LELLTNTHLEEMDSLIWALELYFAYTKMRRPVKRGCNSSLKRDTSGVAMIARLPLFDIDKTANERRPA